MGEQAKLEALEDLAKWLERMKRSTPAAGLHVHQVRLAVAELRAARSIPSTQVGDNRT